MVRQADQAHSPGLRARCRGCWPVLVYTARPQAHGYQQPAFPGIHHDSGQHFHRNDRRACQGSLPPRSRDRTGYDGHCAGRIHEPCSRRAGSGKRRQRYFPDASTVYLGRGERIRTSGPYVPNEGKFCKNGGIPSFLRDTSPRTRQEDTQVACDLRRTVVAVYTWMETVTKPRRWVHGATATTPANEGSND